MNQNINVTSIWTTISKQFIEHKQSSRQHIDNTLFQQQAAFYIIGKDQALFATDLKYSIQLSLTNKNLQQETFNLIAHPFNTLSNDSYTIINNRWNAFNCRQEFLQTDLPAYPDPYKPSFYFKSQYKNFLKQKQSKNNYLHLCEIIKIKKWKLKIVNISSTGYYGPAIQAIDYKIQKPKHKIDLTHVSNVIYEPKIQSWMQNLRLKDIRKLKTDEASKIKQIGLLYYAKQQNISFNSNRSTNIIKIDSAQRILKFYDDPNKYKMILFGDYSGTGCLQCPIDQKALNTQAIKNAYNIELVPLFNLRGRSRQMQAQKNQAEQSLMWSSDDQLSMQEDEEDTAQKGRMIDEDSQQNSDSQDPLRNVYLKQFKQLSIATNK